MYRDRAAERRRTVGSDAYTTAHRPAAHTQAVVLERTMPSEVLNFCLPGKFKRAVTVQSWVLRGFEAAEETVFLTLEEAKGLAGV